MKSDLLSFVLDRTLFRLDPSDDDIERYARILERAAQLAREKYGAGFTVVYWDDDNEPSRRVRRDCARPPFISCWCRMSSREANGRGWHFRGDPHPKAEAHRRLAAALAARFPAGDPAGP